ncbi:MAG: hypothetical protein WCW33_06270 [Candidatus Babeliales bacterium]
MKTRCLWFVNVKHRMTGIGWCLLVQTVLYTTLSPSFAPQSNVVITSGPETDDPQTIGVQGNWLKKRDWLIKAHEVDEEIHSVIAQTESLRASYVQINNQIDVEFDEYYKQLGLGQGKIQELIESVLVYLEQKKTQDLATLTAQIKSGQDQLKIYQIEQTVNKTKKDLDQLRLDMQSIDDLERSLAERLKRFDEQAGIMQEESTKAQGRINQLWSIIDHNKAREYYYELKNGALERVKSANKYLQEDLFNDFKAVVDTIRKQITATRERIKKLEKEDDIWIIDRARRVEEARAREAAQALKKEKTDITHGAKALVKVQQRTWYDPIMNFGSVVMNKIKNMWTWLTSTLWPTKAAGSTKILPPATAPQPGAALSQDLAPTAAMPSPVPAIAPLPINSPMPPLQTVVQQPALAPSPQPR